MLENKVAEEDQQNDRLGNYISKLGHDVAGLGENRFRTCGRRPCYRYHLTKKLWRIWDNLTGLFDQKVYNALKMSQSSE